MEPSSINNETPRDKTNRLLSGPLAWTIPIIMCVALLALTGAVWRLQQIDEWALTQSETSNYGIMAGRQLTMIMANSVRHIHRLWWAGKLNDAHDFTTKTKSLLDRPSVAQFVGWVGDDGTCKYLSGTDSEGLLGKNLRQMPQWADLFSRAPSDFFGAAGPVSVKPDIGPVVDCALYGTDGKAGSPHNGFIIFELSLKPLIAGLSDPRNNGKFVVDVTDGGVPFFRLSNYGQFRDAKPVESESVGEQVAFLDRTWVLRASPTDVFLAQQTSQSPGWVVWTWLGGSAALVAGLCLAIHYQRINYRRQGEYLQALEKIAEVSAGILGKIGSDEEVWQPLVNAARSVMSMSMSAVVILEDNNKTMRFVATAGVNQSTRGVKIRVDEMKTAQQCIETRRPVACPNLDTISMVINRGLAEQYGVRSFIQVPLLVGTEIIGIMMLADGQPRNFNAAEMRLAELWGGLAAVIVSNEKFYEQTHQALNARGRLLQQRDALFALHDAILSPESSDQVLQKIADLAPGTIGFDLCMVELRVGNSDEMLIPAISSDYAPHLKGYRFQMTGFVADKVMRQNKVMIFEDTTHGESLHPYLKTQVPCGSMVFQPLVGTQGVPMGILVLMRKDPGSISTEQLSLVQIFANRAAVVIEIAQLYEKTRQALTARDRLLLQRDALLAVHESVARTDSLTEILQRIADVAPGPVGVDMCVVILLTENPGELRLAATTAHTASHLIGYRYSMEGTNSGKVIHERRPLVIEDGPNDPTIHGYLRTQFPCGSVIYQPLLGTDNRAVGLLGLLRKDPGTFTAEQVNLAQVFASRAAAAIEIAQLHEQTRRDAETKATLLRELNHRVKNNLSGIVTLLTVHQPELPGRARKWLDRAVDRIRMLARTHDALSSELQHASLRELIDQALGALAVVTRPDITVQVSTPPGVFLRSKRAVSVAMVLHELCYNALVHGLADTGTLQVRATVQTSTSVMAGKSLLIEVIDDGRGFSQSEETQVSAKIAAGTTDSDDKIPAAATTRVAVRPLKNLSKLTDSGTGLGLNLVNDFVARELRGTFSIVSRPGEGARARLEFPLLDDELVVVV